VTGDLNLGDLRCPRCLETMDVQGDAHEIAMPDGPLVKGSAWLSCPRCGLVRLM
jgi:uncharacterized C2H2 Zn-finger protein